MGKENGTRRPIPARGGGGRSLLSPGADRSAPTPRKESKRPRHNLEGAFPLLLVGSALLCYAAILAHEEIGSSSAHLPLWGLFGAVGVVIAGAGVYSTIFVPVEPFDTPDDWVTVPKAEWEALRAGRTATARRQAPPPAPSVAAESPQVPRKAPRPIWEEEWDVNSEEFRAAAAPSAAPDFVLRQVEELDAELRKKHTRRPPE